MLRKFRKGLHDTIILRKRFCKWEKRKTFLIITNQRSSFVIILNYSITILFVLLPLLSVTFTK